MMMENIWQIVFFLIGLGGAGKSTVGKILSDMLGYIEIDLDSEFCERISNIRDVYKVAWL